MKLLVSALMVVQTVYVLSCTDGTDNIVLASDCGNGPLKFNPIKIYTYDKNGAALCSGSQGQVSFPGQLKIKSVSGQVTAAVNFENDAQLELTLKKNGALPVAICKDGKHGFPGVPDSWCNFQLCTLPGINQLCQQLGNKVGPFTLAIDSTISLPDLPSFLEPIIKGTFEIEGGLTNTTTQASVGCIKNDAVPAI